jgi:predicted metalloprotease
MRWRDLRRSENVEDRRRVAGPAMALGGGGIVTLIIVVIVALMGGDPSKLVQQLPQGQDGSAQQAGDRQFSAEEQELADFVSAILGDTEDVWTRLFQQAGREYRKPKLVLFTGRVQSGCGMGAAQMGPFYCPEDEKIYIDLSFYRDLKERFRAPGDFAQAYVIAHEVGHHVQKLLGTSDRVHAMRERVSESEYNQLSVRLELQADFFAGVWAHHAQRYRDVLEPGDIEEALRAATAIGDDAIQKQSQGYVVPDSFTHGSSEQRVRWFRRGFESGDPSQGDTFNARDL